jgi:hypothetical protein
LLFLPFNLLTPCLSSFCFFSSPIPPQFAIPSFPSPCAQFILILLYSSLIPPQGNFPFYPAPHAQFLLILLFSSPIPPQFASTQAPLLFSLLFLPIHLIPSFPHFASTQAPLLLKLLFLSIHLLTPCLSSFCFNSSPITPQFAIPSYPSPKILLTPSLSSFCVIQDPLLFFPILLLKPSFSPALLLLCSPLLRFPLSFLFCSPALLLLCSPFLRFPPSYLFCTPALLLLCSSDPRLSPFFSPLSSSFLSHPSSLYFPVFLYRFLSFSAYPPPSPAPCILVIP